MPKKRCGYKVDDGKGARKLNSADSYIINKWLKLFGSIVSFATMFSVLLGACRTSILQIWISFHFDWIENVNFVIVNYRAPIFGVIFNFDPISVDKKAINGIFMPFAS